MEMGFYLMFLNFLCSCNVIPMIIYVIQAIQTPFNFTHV